jgi:hypothetical protein
VLRQPSGIDLDRYLATQKGLSDRGSAGRVLRPPRPLLEQAFASTVPGWGNSLAAWTEGWLPTGAPSYQDHPSRGRRSHQRSGPAFRCTEIRQQGPAALPPRMYRHAYAIASAMGRAEEAWRRELRSITIADLMATTGDKAPAATGVDLRRWHTSMLSGCLGQLGLDSAHLVGHSYGACSLCGLPSTHRDACAPSCRSAPRSQFLAATPRLPWDSRSQPCGASSQRHSRADDAEEADHPAGSTRSMTPA